MQAGSNLCSCKQVQHKESFQADLEGNCEGCSCVPCVVLVKCGCVRLAGSCAQCHSPVVVQSLQKDSGELQRSAAGQASSGCADLICLPRLKAFKAHRFSHKSPLVSEELPVGCPCLTSSVIMSNMRANFAGSFL